MNEADGSQILVGEPVFGVLKKRGEYISAFRSLPSVPVKHGELLNIYQYVRNGLPFLNIDTPSKARTSTNTNTSARARRDLRAGGLKIAVEIGASQAEVQWAKLANVELRRPLKVMALIDTGASVTVINPQVAVTCGLRHVGQAAITTTGHVDTVPTYAGAIRFPDSKMQALDPVRFIATALPGSDFSCLIGRDILEAIS